MKHFYKKALLSVFSLATASLFAQAPTITQADLPMVGHVYINDVDTTYTNLFLTPASGTMQAWNYANAFIVTDTDTTQFVSPTGLTGAGSFPTSNIAVAAPADSNNTFFIANASGFHADGAFFWSSLPNGALNYNPNYTLVPTPVTLGFNQNFNSAITFTASISGQSITVLRTMYSTITSDAYGSLVTPSTSYANTLRLKTVEMAYDSAFLFYGTPFQTLVFNGGDTTTTYRWLKNGGPAIVMEISLDAQNNYSGASYNKMFVTGVASNNISTGMNVYPNPAKDMITFNLKNMESENATLYIMDALGKVVYQQNISNSGANQNVHVNLNNFSEGIYIYRLSSENFNKTGKFIKN